MRQVVPVSRRRGGWEHAPEPRAACLGFHWAWEEPVGKRTWPWKSLLRWKGAVSEHIPPPATLCCLARLTASAVAALSSRKQLLALFGTSLPATSGRASIGPAAGLLWPKGARKSERPASTVDCFYALHLYVIMSLKEVSSKVKSGHWRRWATREDQF